MPRIESLPLPPGLRSSPWTGVGDVYEVQEHLLLHYLGVKTGQDARVLPYKSAGSGGVWTCGFWAQPNWPWSHRHITWPAGRFFLYMLSHPGSPWDLAVGSKTCHLILSSCRSVRPEVGEAMAQVGGSRWDVSTVLGASAALCGHLGGGESASERRGILWRWRGPSGLRWVWRNGRGPHLDVKGEGLSRIHERGEAQRDT